MLKLTEIIDYNRESPTGNTPVGKFHFTWTKKCVQCYQKMCSMLPEISIIVGAIYEELYYDLFKEPFLQGVIILCTASGAPVIYFLSDKTILVLNGDAERA